MSALTGSDSAQHAALAAFPLAWLPSTDSHPAQRPLSVYGSASGTPRSSHSPLANIEPEPVGLLAAMRNDSVVWARSLASVPNDDLQCPHGAELGLFARDPDFGYQVR